MGDAKAVGSSGKAPALWSGEENFRVVQESFERGNRVCDVADYYGIPRGRLSAWRKAVRQVKLLAPRPRFNGGFATLQVEDAELGDQVDSMVIEACVVTVRLAGQVCI